ncbi:Lycopene cyclase protein [Fragilaria crotonensis]|nr:Lycopene cyclase protein [Fragilaria crotonensis]
MNSRGRYLALLQVLVVLALPIPGSVVAFVIPSPVVTGSRTTTTPTSSTRVYSPFQQYRGGINLGIGQSTSSNNNNNDGDDNIVCDVLVLGSGPAGRAISRLLEQKNLLVCLADATYDRPLVPNYGVWQDEWDAVVARYAKEGIDLTGGTYGKALNREWSQTDCFFGGSFGKSMTERTVIDRPYCQVDKNALKQSLTSPSQGVKIIRANHQSKATSVNIYSPPGTLQHDEQGTTTVLKDLDGNDITVRSKLVVDTTGHESKLVLRDARAPANGPPGFQIAYGCLVKVNEADPENAVAFGPYDKEAMTLFDYRTDHLEFDPQWEKRAIQDPTFMYVMPLEGNRVFFEETSLVARPAVSFQECKERCFKRLEYLGIDVAEIEEEEYCYIPMGGSLPLKDQRVIALGGSAAMVHPSTGYHLCRMLMGAASVADAISRELSKEGEEQNLDRAAASAYHSLWSPETIRQRNFAVFGGEFLMKQSVVGLRGFFDGFFKLPLELWAGFLAGWPGLPNNDKHESWSARIWFGLNFIVRLPPQVALEMFASIVQYSLTEGAPLPQSVTPFLGAPPSYDYRDFGLETVGDGKAKAEAKRLITASKVTELLPPAFEDGVDADTVFSASDVTVEESVSEVSTEEPIAEAVVEEPIAESVVEEPIAESVVEEPFAEPVLEEPIAEPVVEEPIAEPVVEEPIADAEVEEPIAQSVVEEVATLETAEQPEDPSTGESDAPVLEQPSVVDDEVIQPAVGSLEESAVTSISASQDFSQNSFE